MMRSNRYMLGFLVAFSLVALLGNPMAINPMVSAPLVMEAHAQTTQTVGQNYDLVEDDY